jgi:mono/diheme cytochrome c family protein
MYGKLSFSIAVLSAAIAVSMPQTKTTTQNKTPTQAKTTAQNADQNEIARGKYLVEEIGKCTECHTPRDANGQLIREKWMQGAEVWITPVHPTPDWAVRVPPLAGFPSLTEEQGEQVLEQGIGPDGKALRPPMHIYHMNHADAKAVIAYLRSLPAASANPN